VRWETVQLCGYKYAEGYQYSYVVTNMLKDMNTSNYENQSIFDRVIRKIETMLFFLVHSVYMLR